MIATPCAAADSSIYAGIKNATLVDFGTFVVTGGGPFDRVETFEYLKRPDGGYTLVNTQTASSGAYRAQGRFDFDANWRAQSAHGIGVYSGLPVRLTLQRRGNQVDVEVAPIDGDTPAKTTTVAVCDPDCFLDMSPSITPMFVMTRHFDFARGGEQEFRWAAQDLDQSRTLSGGTVRVRFAGEKTVPRVRETALRLRHFTFIESIPLPNGGAFLMNFDLWTDPEHRPIAFRAKAPNGIASGIFGLRQSHEDLRMVLNPVKK